MNENKDLEFLKSKYMDQSYPEDMDKYVLKAIVEFYENKPKKKYFNIKQIALLVACFFVVLVSLNKNNITDTSFKYDARTLNLINEVEEDFQYELGENEYIISVYPKNKMLDSNDLIYNISKLTGKEILFKDILLDNIDTFRNELDEINSYIFDENNKFFIDSDGDYIVITTNENYKNNFIKINRDLQNKIFKKEYVIK